MLLRVLSIWRAHFFFLNPLGIDNLLDNQVRVGSYEPTGYVDGWYTHLGKDGGWV